MTIPPPWNPSQNQFGTLPSQPKPYLQIWAPSSNFTGYLRGVLKFRTGHDMPINANPGPWPFDTAVRNGLIDLQTYLGLSVTGTANAQTWSWIDWLALHP